LQLARPAVEFLASRPLPIGELRSELGRHLLRPVLDRPVHALPLVLVGEQLDAGRAARLDALHAAITPAIWTWLALEPLVGPGLRLGFRNIETGHQRNGGNRQGE